MLNKEAFAKRLQELMNYQEISAASLADSIGVQRSSISHLLSGRNNPSLDFILKILENYPKISFEWLVKGIGSIESKLDNQDESNSAPTLFDMENRENSAKKPIKKGKYDATVSNRHERTIDKILLLYTDGSFEVFKK